MRSVTRQVLVWPLDAEGCHGLKVVTHDRQLMAVADEGRRRSYSWFPAPIPILPTDL
jgi:hypothetical protein